MVKVNPELEPLPERELLHGDDRDIFGTETVCFALKLIKSSAGHILLWDF